MSNIEEQAPCYCPGTRIEVGILLPDASVFRDWAIINEVEDDLVLLQLSRDVLPSGVTLRVGQILTIRSEIDFQIYSSSAFIVSKGYDQELLLRLTGNISREELREFYRINSFLPINTHRLPDQDPITVMNYWEKQQAERRKTENLRRLRLEEIRREKILEEERDKKKLFYESHLIGDKIEQQAKETYQEQNEANEYEEVGLSIPVTAVNISAGGLKMSSPQEFSKDEVVLLEIFVPTSKQYIDVVARVIFSTPCESSDKEIKFFNTGMQFTLITESAHYAINNYISKIQLQRIRHKKGLTDLKPLIPAASLKPDIFIGTADSSDIKQDNLENLPAAEKYRFRHLCIGLLFISIALPIYFYYAKYNHKYTKNQIQVQVEESINRITR